MDWEKRYLRVARCGKAMACMGIAVWIGWKGSDGERVQTVVMTSAIAVLGVLAGFAMLFRDEVAADREEESRSP